MITTPTDLLSALLADLNTAVGADIGPLEAIAEEFVVLLEEIYADAGGLDAALADLRGKDAEAWAGLIGVFRLVATGARATVTLTGDEGTTIPAGARVATASSVPPPEDLAEGGIPDSVLPGILENASAAETYETADAVTLEPVRVVVPEVDDELSVGELFTITDPARPSMEDWTYECTTAGDLGATNTLAMLLAEGGDNLQANGTAVFRSIGRGRAAASVSVNSVEPLDEGPIAGALARLGSVNGYDDVDAVLEGIVLIESPVPGWRSVLNRLAGDAGRLSEDAERLLERASRSAAHDRGNSYNGGQGLEATLVRIPGVTAARVVIDEVAHTAAVQVVGGDAATIARAIHRVIPHSLTLTADDPVTTEAEEVVRADGLRRTIVFQRPAAVTVDVTATIVVSSIDYVGDEALTEQLQELTITNQARVPSKRLQLGEDVYASRMACELLDVEGVLSADKVEVSVINIADYQYAEIGTVTLTKQVAT